ncbi:MAG: hypothetical protein RI911_582 [Candidatus Parcubacteria bacterium]|jgi:predicted N-formylglutamate amidohydrolase
MYHASSISLDSPLLLTCEHASTFIPPEYNNLGLTEHQTSHCKDLDDPGVVPLLDGLARHFECSSVRAEVSRLVVDVNRRIDAHNKNANTFHSSLIKTQILVEDGRGEYFVDIPHNQKKIQEEGTAYEQSMYELVSIPYQKEILRIVDMLIEKHGYAYVLSVHTMFPTYNGPLRPHIFDVMGYDGSPLFESLFANLAQEPVVVGKNEPWGMASVDGGALHVLMGNERVSFAGVEVRNDIAQSASEQTIKRLIHALEPIVSQKLNAPLG